MLSGLQQTLIDIDLCGHAGQFSGYCVVSAQLLLPLRKCQVCAMLQRLSAKGTEVFHRNSGEWQHDDAAQHSPILLLTICQMLYGCHICFLRMMHPCNTVLQHNAQA